MSYDIRTLVNLRQRLNLFPNTPIILRTAIRGPMMLGFPMTPSPSSARGIMLVIVLSQFEINLKREDYYSGEFSGEVRGAHPIACASTPLEIAAPPSFYGFQLCKLRFL